LSMVRKLWSLSALSTELGRDRRTVSKILATTPPDGRPNGHPAWLLTTALRALYAYEEPQPASAANSAGVFLGSFINRVVHWQEIHRGPQIEWTIEATAERLGLTVETVVIWLRSGMPYAREGDWATGAGFVLVPSWVIDWQAKLTVLNKLFGDQHTARQLAIDEAHR
jgi:hypothetical protein